MITLTGTEESASQRVAVGVYASSAEIISIENKSNLPGYPNQEIGSKGYMPEICLIVKYKKEDREKDLYLFGYYKKDKTTGKIKSWDTYNNSVLKFAVAAAGKIELEDDLSIRSGFLESLVGKEFVIVSYISSRGYEGKDGVFRDYSYSDWNRTFAVDTPIEQIAKEWSDNLKYVKDYYPEKIEELQKTKEEEETSFSPEDRVPDDEPII